jgi:glycopeptide antibiotics resistance protein
MPATPADVSQRLAAARAPARLAYLGMILLATLSGLRLDLDPGDLGDRLSRMWAFEVRRSDVIDGARNVLLFAGWGLVWMLTAVPGRSRVALRGAVLSGMALSISVETIQLLSARRVASVLDLITNTGGALLGALAVVAVVRLLAALSASRSLTGLPAVVFAGCASAAALAEAFVPLFRQEVLAFGGPFERLRATLAELQAPSPLELPFSDLVLFVPVGVLLAASLFEAGVLHRRAPLLLAGVAAGALAAMEVMHGALGLRIDSSALLLHVFGVTGGLWLGVRWVPRFARSVRGVDRPRLLALAYAAVLVLWAIRPYALELSMGALAAKLQGDWWVPLESLGGRADMFSVVDVFVAFALYVPVGALLAVWPLRRHGVLAGFLPAIALGLATEVAQTFVVGRSLDITDALIQASGAVVGWVVVRRAGFRVAGELVTETG